MNRIFERAGNACFILGPIDFDVLMLAFQLEYHGHSAAKLLMLLYYERGKRRLSQTEYIQCNNFYLDELGITRRVKNELLRRMEVYKLVKVQWRKGMSPYVQILDRPMPSKVTRGEV
jgi:hypothetical protein